jgi:hypothetical protein
MGKDKVPKEVMEYFLRQRQEQEILKIAGIHAQHVNPVVFQGGKVWAIGSRIYNNRPLNETFHVFIIQILKETIGLDWWKEQSALPEVEQHYIFICLAKLGEWIEKQEKIAKRDRNGVWGAKPDGYSKYLLSLAFDVVSLIHTNKLPEELLGRLKSREHFQGARYEIAIAAVFSRLGCDIDFTDSDNKEKRCEFFATHKETKYKLAVEVKSRKRTGILHEGGYESEIEKLLSGRTGTRRTFNRALKQNPKTVPFAVFIDVNSPLTPEVPLNSKPWVKDAMNIVEKKLKGKLPTTYPLNAAFFTNFSYHYQTDEPAGNAEMVGMTIPHPDYPPLNDKFFKYLENALMHYGFVPNIDIDRGIEVSD